MAEDAVQAPLAGGDDQYEGNSVESSAGPSRKWVDRACDRCRKRKAKCGMSTRFLALTPAFFRLHPLTITRQFDALQELLCGLSTMYSSSPYTEAWTKTKVSSLSALLVRPLLMSTRPSEQSRNSQARDRLMTSVPPDADQSGRMDTDLPDDNQVQSSEPQNGHASSSTSSSATTRPPGPIPNSAQRSDGGVTSSIVPAPSSTALLDWAMGPLATSGSDSQLLQRINGPNELDTTIGGFSSVPGANQRTELDQQHRGFGEGQAAGSTHDLSWIGPSEDPSSSSSDMLYRDAGGETRFLGPSSGMPLLERLKPSSESSNRRRKRGNQADEWLSLSAAIGMEVEQSTPYAGVTYTPEAQTVTSPEEIHCWGQLEAVCPGSLIECLVKAYFTISYLLWPILHAPTFMEDFHNQQTRRDPSFVALVSSMCCLSCRYAQDPRVNAKLSHSLLDFTSKFTTSLALDHANIRLIQALFNMSVVQEGTERPSLLWGYLGPAISMAIDLGLHRKVDDWASFDTVEIEVRKRTMWALYSQNVKASSTFGRPPLLRLTDLDIEEPCPVDDVHIDSTGVGLQPSNRASVVAGFVIAVRLHMILERTIRRINAPKSDHPGSTSFSSLVTATTTPKIFSEPDELALLPKITDGLNSRSDWAFTSSTVLDPDNAAFFEKTRIFAFQHFIRLLIARHRFSLALGRMKKMAAGISASSEGNDVGLEGLHDTMDRMIKSALAIVGTYSEIDGQGRLGFFGAHAIVQLSQAGAGLVGLILHLRNEKTVKDESIHHLAIQGLPTAIRVLRQLGLRRPAGRRAADVLVRFAKACNIPVFLGLSTMSWIDQSGTSDLGNDSTMNDASNSDSEEIVPMLRTLTRRPSPNMTPAGAAQESWFPGGDFDQWLGLALQDAQSGVEGYAVGLFGDSNSLQDFTG